MEDLEALIWSVRDEMVANGELRSFKDMFGIDPPPAHWVEADLLRIRRLDKIRPPSIAPVGKSAGK